ncbi:MAG: AraC family ligand binding domain-containing protein [Halobacteriota archaeon]
MRGSKEELPIAIERGGFVFRGATWGGMHVEIDTFNEEFDVTPLLKGFPNDMAPSPQWGYVFAGRVRVKYKDREETVNAGDVFYMEPGHTAVFEAGTEIVMFTPEEELRKAAAIMERNRAAMQQER